MHKVKQRQIKDLSLEFKQKILTHKRKVKNSLCSPVYLKKAFLVFLLILVYFFFSIGLTFYQKWFIKDFKYPLSVVICHLVIKFLMAAFVRALYELHTENPRIMLNWAENIKRIAPTGAASSLDIGLANWSFEFINVSLYTMSKSTVIIFILFFSVMLKLEKLRISLVLIVSLIATGLFMYTYESTEFNLTGFTLVMGSAVFGGLRWSLAQLVTQRKDIGLDVSVSTQIFRYSSVTVFARTCALILIGGTVAFLMEVSEYLVLVYTSALTISIAGIVKELITLALAHFVNGDEVSPLNTIGLVLCITGISLHIITKAVQAREEQHSVMESEAIQLLLANESEDEEDDDVLFEKNNVRHALVH